MGAMESRADAPRRDPTPRRVLAGATTANTFAVLPLFLVGALAVFVRDELDFTEVQLGLAVATFSLASTSSAVAGGRFAERIGTSPAMRVGVATSATGLASIALLAQGWATLCAGLALAGVGNAITQPATNGALARGMPAHRQALAFGIKQSSLPLAGSIAGLTVPLLGLTLGWRWSFGLAALVAAAVILVVPGRSGAGAAGVAGTGGEATAAGEAGTAADGAAGEAAAPSGGSGPRREAPLRALVILAAAGTFGAAAANALMAFFVESLVATGIDEARAGVLLALGGASGVVARVFYGWRADRRGRRHLWTVGVLLASGSSGYLLLALGSAAPLPGGAVLPLVAVATVLCFAAGWGWPGLFAYAVARRNPSRPAAATGVTQTGIFAGALLGPPLFGLVVSTAGYGPAWAAAAGASLVAAAFIAAGRASLAAASPRRPQQRPAS